MNTTRESSTTVLAWNTVDHELEESTKVSCFTSGTGRMLEAMHDIFAVYASGVAFGGYAYSEQRITYRRRAESETGHRQLRYTKKQAKRDQHEERKAMEPEGWATTRKYRIFMM